MDLMKKILLTIFFTCLYLPAGIEAATKQEISKEVPSLIQLSTQALARHVDAHAKKPEVQDSLQALPVELQELVQEQRISDYWGAIKTALANSSFASSLHVIRLTKKPKDSNALLFSDDGELLVTRDGNELSFSEIPKGAQGTKKTFFIPSIYTINIDKHEKKQPRFALSPDKNYFCILTKKQTPEGTQDAVVGINIQKSQLIKYDLGIKDAHIEAITISSDGTKLIVFFQLEKGTKSFKAIANIATGYFLPPGNEQIPNFYTLTLSSNKFALVDEPAINLCNLEGNSSCTTLSPLPDFVYTDALFLPYTDDIATISTNFQSKEEEEDNITLFAGTPEKISYTDKRRYLGEPIRWLKKDLLGWQQRDNTTATTQVIPSKDNDTFILKDLFRSHFSSATEANYTHLYDTNRFIDIIFSDDGNLMIGLTAGDDIIFFNSYGTELGRFQLPHEVTFIYEKNLYLDPTNRNLLVVLSDQAYDLFELPLPPSPYTTVQKTAAAASAAY